MAVKTPYQIIKKRHLTEKAQTLSQLKDKNSNRSLARCKSSQYVFIVDPTANKREIAQAIQEIYREKNIKVVSVNTITGKTKAKRRGRYLGRTANFKKAIVTLGPQESLD